MAPTPKLDQYAILRAAILENDERDAKVAKSCGTGRDLERSARSAPSMLPRRGLQTRSARQSRTRPSAIMAEADWEAEIWLIDREEASLP